MSDTPDQAAEAPRTEPAAAEPDEIESGPELPPAGIRPEYDGEGAALGKLVITNSLLTLATLGIYRFWAKTRVRRYFWSRISFLGDRFEYTGTGRELFFGFLIALAALAVVFGVPIGMELALGIDHPAYWAVRAVSTLVLLFLVFVAHFRARRYRLSRTEWRGIRFAQDGSSVRYAFLALGWAAVAALTLGLAYPVYRMRVQRFRTRHTTFGDRRFVLDGQARRLFMPWLLAWVFLAPTLGMTYIWYRVREFRYLAGTTRCGNLSFASDLGASSIVIFFIVYYVAAALFMFLFGISFSMIDPSGPTITLFAGIVVMVAVLLTVLELLAAVILLHPICRVVMSSVRVLGEEDYERIAQSSLSTPRRGEGLADALDVGAF